MFPFCKSFYAKLAAHHTQFQLLGLIKKSTGAFDFDLLWTYEIVKGESKYRYCLHCKNVLKQIPKSSLIRPIY